MTKIIKCKCNITLSYTMDSQVQLLLIVTLGYYIYYLYALLKLIIC